MPIILIDNLDGARVINDNPYRFATKKEAMEKVIELQNQYKEKGIETRSFFQNSYLIIIDRV